MSIPAIYFCQKQHINFSNKPLEVCRQCHDTVELLVNPPDDELIISNSMMANLTDCPKQQYFSFVLGIKSKYRSEPALAFGTLWHRLMQEYYSYNEKDHPDIEDHTYNAMNLAITTVLQEAQKYPEIPVTTTTGVKHSLEILFKMFHCYINKYGARNYAYVDVEGKKLAEIRFQLAHEHEGKVYAVEDGVLDGVVEYNGGLWLLDHKTTSVGLTDDFISTYSISNQFTGYMWAATTLIPVPLKGMIVDVAYVSKNPSEKSFTRVFITFTKEDIEEWLQERRILINQYNTYKQTNIWPRYTKNCYAYFRQCSFLSICKSFGKNPVTYARVEADYLLNESDRVRPLFDNTRRGWTTDNNEE